MPWREYDPRPYLHRSFEPERTTRLEANELCFMRRQHSCEKVFGASKSCFVACPTDPSLEPLLALIEAKLAAHGVEAVIAVKERAYGQDIVCTKICGRIIESRFCIVILDESVRDGASIPNPNVYYEYGLMTALRKHVIPLQREGLPLAFNIQSQDTVKYTPVNMADELERAIRDAIAQTEPGQNAAGVEAPIGSRAVRRRLELAGFTPADRSAAVYDTVADTQMIAFSPSGRVQSGYLILAKLDDDGDVSNYREDLPVVVYRLRDLLARTDTELESLPGRIASLEARLASRSDRPEMLIGSWDVQRELDKARERSTTLQVRRARLSSAAVGFVASPTVDIASLRETTEATLAETPFVPTWNEGNHLHLGAESLVLDAAVPRTGGDRNDDFGGVDEVS